MDQRYYQTPDGKLHAYEGGWANPGFPALSHYEIMHTPWYHSFFIFIPLLILAYAAIIYFFGLAVGIICFFVFPVILLIYRETLPLPKLYTEAEIRDM